jgi:hypothetical protein
LKNSKPTTLPRLDLPFYLAVDSSAQGIGYVLYQKHAENLGEKMRVIKVTYTLAKIVRRGSVESQVLLNLTVNFSIF